jgi:hypothetical protein
MIPHSYAHLICDEGAKDIWWRKDSIFNTCCWEKCFFACKTLKLDPCLSPCTSINSKWIKPLNIRSKTPKLVQERSGNTLEAIGIGKDFFNRTPAVQQLRERMDKWDYIKLKSSAQQKKCSLNWRDHPQSGRKLLPAIHQTNYYGNIQGAQKIKLSQHQWSNKEMFNWTK